MQFKSDMVTFDGDVHDVTPANYFEGPVMVKRHGKYFLMYSNGVTVSRVIGSPIVVPASAPARYVRLVAPASVKGESFSIVECSLHE